MRQTAVRHSHIGSVVVSSYAPCPARRTRSHRLGFTARGLFHNPRGFTLIELVVAMAILLVVMIGVLSAISFAYTSSNDTEMRNTAKNVASYTLEYLRARTVTRGTSKLMASLGMTLSSTGTYGWYDASANASGLFPSMIDAENLPIQSNGKPCNYLWTYVQSAGKTDGSQNAGTPAADISAAGQVFNFSSMHPALPTETFSTTPLAWTTTLQGYVSVRGRLPDDVTSLSATQNPAPEDFHLARLYFSASTYPNNANGCYRTRLTDLTSAGAWTGLIVQYPGVYLATPPALAITSFTPGSTYMAKIWTTDSNKMLKTNQEYNPYYTNGSDGTTKAATQDYRGFRVLTAIVARVPTPVPPAVRLTHVAYYDVTVTVLWMNGTHESNYELTSQIVAY
ncbi:MAG: type IV pilus modification PilV family protein [Candidatus Cryosericum sp.]